MCANLDAFARRTSVAGEVRREERSENRVGCGEHAVRDSFRLRTTPGVKNIREQRRDEATGNSNLPFVLLERLNVKYVVKDVNYLVAWHVVRRTDCRLIKRPSLLPGEPFCSVVSEHRADRLVDIELTR